MAFKLSLIHIYIPIVHFIFEIPFYNRSIFLVEELFNFPNNDFATGIPFLKPVFYDLTIKMCIRDRPQTEANSFCTVPHKGT